MLKFEKKMKTLVALCTISLLLVQEAICSAMRQQMLTQFQAKLQEMAVTKPPFPFSSPKKDGRVFYPIGYGADPTGAQDSSDAILKALGDALKVQNGSELLPGINDLGGVVIDFQGGNYKISKPIRFPAAAAGNLVMKGGTLRASNTFPGNRHIIELWSPNSELIKEIDSYNFNHLININQQDNVGIYYEDITFRDILFDSSFRGGGILIIDSTRIRIDNCFFLHFTTQGILVERGHETFISSSFLGQHSTVGKDKGEKDYSGTAIDIAGVHCYNKATSFGGVGILVKIGASLTRLDNCYMDFTAIVIEDPSQVHVTNGLFFGDANVVLKSIKGQISGINIVNNMFNGDPRFMNPVVKLDGDFTSIDQVVINKNNVQGMSMKSTEGKLMVTGNGTKWVADFSLVLVFPNRIRHFQYSFYVLDVPAAGLVTHAVTNVSNNLVVVESNTAVNGIVSVAVDQ
ncbi:polygalacturonase QRT3 isoform X2 [Hevea brasiliensis]|uniref:polygalacturonase QRT3 isoform X2 n=1 Tax=Hevea brasiliensis TaxID=3981 RepID=UPI0025D764CD|nr:polygalacturonase QRT3 isoform X2 [Hevea brasiliensis]